MVRRFYVYCVSCTVALGLFAQSVSYHGVASTKQIMAGIQKPAMDGLAATLRRAVANRL